MKGIVFAEFVEFVERDLPDAAGCVAGRRYRHDEHPPDDELLALVDATAAAAGTSAADVLRRFGVHLFGAFANLYPVFLTGEDSALSLLVRIDSHVHDEVRKLYPDAAFPRFEVSHPAAGTLELVYGSPRPLADLADGMIRGCIAHFGEPIDVRREDLGAGDGRAARFTLTAHSSQRRRRRGSGS
ncbi:MAG TPA: heme NO-binding domain-containing protein [Candidatus Binatia bacterium]|jgi:hypothetical protein|nr:heme NO-binding domain-containing protein [Candidatus Binatia bacterium]